MIKRVLNIRITPEEYAILLDYTKRTGRTKTEVVRDMIRSLSSKKKDES